MASDGKTSVMDPDLSELADTKNSKGHGFHCFKHDGLYFFMLPDPMMKGQKQADRIKSVREAELEDDDIIICAYPKCGTHWLWEVIEMLISGTIHYQKDVKETRMFEFISKDGIEAIPRPRVFNTHLPLRMFPKQVVEKKIKCIQIMRNPKDVCVSFFNHSRDLTPPYAYEGDFAEYTEAFLSEKMPFGSYTNYLLSWKAEVAAAPELPVLDLFYEDMKCDPVKAAKDIAKFLGLSSTDKYCEEVALACSFKKMKKVDEEMKEGIPLKIWADGSEGTFYRKGEIGDWKNWFSVAESERFDQKWNAKMKGSGFKFTYTPV